MIQIMKPLPSPTKPKVSILLLDWSVRESFHMLDYLNKQTIPRDQYEILWIEYYQRRAGAIQSALDRSQKNGTAPCVDQWIVLEMPENHYYHKHLMYNVGIVMSRGKITVICDSDVMVKPTFVESIVEEFEKNSRIALHLDEVRNTRRKYYPFNYPSFEEVTGAGCINWKNGATTGILEEWDVLHNRNYGACLCALREDLLEIGGADEDISYLGHICGPYELTFRLVNHGRKEIWHPSEFLFHTWHPGTDGMDNYLGPHDGKNMSLTALEARQTGRIRPLVENRAIRLLREKSTENSAPEECLLPVLEMTQWKKKNLRPSFDVKFILKGLVQKARYYLGGMKPLMRLKLELLMMDLFFNQLRQKAQGRPGVPVMKKNMLDKISLAYAFARRLWKNNLYIVRNCEKIVDKLKSQGVNRIALYGTGQLVRPLRTLIQTKPVKFDGVYDPGIKIELKNYEGAIILCSLTDSPADVQALRQLGLPDENIIRMQSFI